MNDHRQVHIFFFYFIYNYIFGWEHFHFDFSIILYCIRYCQHTSHHITSHTFRETIQKTKIKLIVLWLFVRLRTLHGIVFLFVHQTNDANLHKNETKSIMNCKNKTNIQPIDWTINIIKDLHSFIIFNFQRIKQIVYRSIRIKLHRNAFQNQ